MENNEFLIDHRIGNANVPTSSQQQQHHLMDDDEEDFVDHSQFKAPLSSAIGGGGANNNLLLLEAHDNDEVGGGGADGTFLVDEAPAAAASDDDDDDSLSQPPSLSPFPRPPHSQQQQHEDGDDDICQAAKHHPQQQATPAPAEVAVEANPPHPPPHTSSSIDDFEFIATPQATADNTRDVKTTMDNLLDFDAAAPVAAPAPPPANLVETLLTTGDDLKPHKDSAAAYLENEFAQFSSASQQAQDSFMNLTSTLPNATKPIQDVYNDFMAAERGGVNVVKPQQQPNREASPEPEEVEIETVSSTPIVVLKPTTATAIGNEEPPQLPIKSQFEASNDGFSADDADDLLEQFSSTAPPPPLPVRQPIVIEDEKKRNVMDDEQPKVAAMPVPVPVPVFVEEPKAKQQQELPKPEEKKVEVIKPKEVEVSKPTVTPVAAPLPVQKPTTTKPAKDELITTSAEEMFCKFGLGELRILF